MLFQRPQKRYAGYIFDCDGTLAHSMPAHYRAWAKTVDELGVSFSEAAFYSLGGIPTDAIVEFLNQQSGRSLDPVTVAARKEELYLQEIATIRELSEIADFAREMAREAKVSVASGGILPVVLQTLTAIGMRELFQIVVTTEQVARGKPFPDLFVEAARRMDVVPEQCVVFEDSASGIEAAKSAGMDYVLVGRPE